MESNMEARRRRLYRTNMSLMLYWQSHGYQVLRVDLTSAVGSDWTKLRHRYKQLRRKIEQEYNFPGIENFILETSEGNGVLHMLLAWKSRSQFDGRRFFIPKQWISDEWARLHEGSKIVMVKKVTSGDKSRRNISRYLVSQYLKDHSEAIVRYSYSWGRSIGVPLGKTWKLFREHHFNYLGAGKRDLIDRWERFLMGDRLEGKGRPMLRIDELRHYL